MSWSLKRLFTSLTRSVERRPASRPSRSVRPSLEGLDERIALSTFHGPMFALPVVHAPAPILHVAQPAPAPVHIVALAPTLTAHPTPPPAHPPLPAPAPAPHP